MMLRPHASFPSRQRGMATVYIVLAVGLAVSVTVAGSIYALRGNVQRQVTTHSVTAAQAAAWRGVEVVRRYLEAVDSTTLSQWASGSGLVLPATVQGLGELGIPDGNARITAFSGTGSSFQATVSITALAGTGATTTSATVEVVYDIGAGAGSTSGGGQCAVIPVAPLVFNGNLEIGGAALDVRNADGFEQIAVNGNITQNGSSSTMISGCATGNISLNGGGVVSGGHLFAGGTLLMDAMQTPSDATLWARNITITQGTSGGRLTAVQAGAYSTEVYSGDTRIGTADVGGRLVPSTVSGGLPWSVGTVVPATTMPVAITLSTGDVFLLDLPRAQIDSSNGTVTGAAAAERLSGSSSTPLPDRLTFRAVGIAGGTVKVASPTITTTWGHLVQISGYDGVFGTVQANGDLEITQGRFDRIVGGRDLIAKQGNYWYGYPTIGSGDIAGILRDANGAKAVADPSVLPKNLREQQTGTSPGLPGIPFCDTRVNAIDVSNYRGAANYIFEWKDDAPRLTIQNVTTADGRSLAGQYNLLTDDLRRLPGLDQEFLACNWNVYPQASAHCFRDKTASSVWSLKGLRAFPRGVAWFDNDFTVDGQGMTSNDGVKGLINTVIAKGAVNLTTSGSDWVLTAPNFATPAQVCSGALRPTQLCDMTGATPQFTEWKDTDGVSHRGIPTANMALVTEGQATFGSWTINGNVLLGRGLGNNAARTLINGTLTVGSNAAGSNTAIGSGGATVTVPSNSDQQYQPGICEAPVTTPGTAASASVRWSRYL